MRKTETKSLDINTVPGADYLTMFCRLVTASSIRSDWTEPAF